MIPRYQRVLFYTLLASILLMAIFLFYERKRASDRLTAQNDAAPLSAPLATGTESFTLDLSKDSDGSITAVQREIALPQEPSVKARALLEHLMAEYALPKSGHPLASGAAVDDVFLVNLPIEGVLKDASATGLDPVTSDPDSTGQMAVVNLRGSFVNEHPSGVEVEMLTLLSILGTLHANFPQITQVQFLVDGQRRDTFAGHADLNRVYPAFDTTAGASQTQPSPESAGGSQ